MELNFNSYAIKELKKLSKLKEFESIESFLEDKILMMLINEITASDVENAKKQIEDIQERLNTKREEISNLLRKGGD
jgi:uncharacterized protein YwgA